MLKQKCASHVHSVWSCHLVCCQSISSPSSGLPPRLLSTTASPSSPMCGHTGYSSLRLSHEDEHLTPGCPMPRSYNKWRGVTACRVLLSAPPLCTRSCWSAGGITLWNGPPLKHCIGGWRTTTLMRESVTTRTQECEMWRINRSK